MARVRSFRDANKAIPDAMAAGESFKSRVASAEGDVIACARLMAEAISMDVAANGLEVVGYDGRVRLSFESIVAAHCMIAARDAFQRADK